MNKCRHGLLSNCRICHNELGQSPKAENDVTKGIPLNHKAVCESMLDKLDKQLDAVLLGLK